MTHDPARPRPTVAFLSALLLALMACTKGTTYREADTADGRESVPPRSATDPAIDRQHYQRVVETHHSKIALVVAYDFPADWTEGTGSYTGVYAPDSPHEHFYGGSSFKVWVTELHGGRFDDRSVTLGTLEERYPPHYLNNNGKHRVFSSRVVRYLGTEARVTEYAPARIWDRQREATIDSTSPMLLALETIVDGRLWVKIEFEARSEALFKRWQPTVEQMLASLSVRPLSEVAGADDLLVPYRSEPVRLSVRRDYHMDVEFETRYPSHWTPVRSERTPASPERERGRLIVEFLAPEESGDAIPARVAVILEGLAVGYLSRGDFLATTEPLVEEVRQVSSLTLVSTVETVHYGTQFLARQRFRRSESTGTAVVRVYTATAANGSEVRIKALTAGGASVAANLIYLADQADFEVHRTAAEKIIHDLQVNIFSPSLLLD